MTAKRKNAKKIVVKVQAPKKGAKPHARRNAVLKSVSKSAIGSLGGIAGSYLGGPIGATLGRAAGDMLAKVTGFGDYKVSQNSLYMGSPVPTFAQSGTGMEVVHREFIKDIVGSVGFNIEDLHINPGIAETFPWLSTIAKGFEEYEMKGLLFEYRPSSGSAVSSTSASLGTVIFATDYNCIKEDFTTKQEMESYQFSVSTVPFVAMTHPIECARRSNVLDNLYVRTGPAPAGTDQRFYDLGSFQFATQGMQSAYTVGELWVTYHVSLKKPRIDKTAIPPAEDFAFFHAQEGPSTSATTNSPFGTTGIVIKSSTTLTDIVASVATPGKGVIVPTVGTYFAYFSCINASGVMSGAPSFTLGANMTIQNIFSGAAALSGASASNGVALAVFFTVDLAGTTAANEFIVTNATLSQPTGHTDLVIVLVPDVVNLQTLQAFSNLKIDSRIPDDTGFEEKSSCKTCTKSAQT